MTASIGKRKVIHTQTLLLADGEDAQISFQIGTWTAKARVVFKAGEPSQSPQIDSTIEHDQAVLVFTGWRNSLGTATSVPLEFAKMSNGQVVKLMAAHWLVGSANKVDLQFTLEDK